METHQSPVSVSALPQPHRASFIGTSCQVMQTVDADMSSCRHKATKVMTVVKIPVSRPNHGDSEKTVCYDFFVREVFLTKNTHMQISFITSACQNILWYLGFPTKRSNRLSGKLYVHHLSLMSTCIHTKCTNHIYFHLTCLTTVNLIYDEATIKTRTVCETTK